MSALLVHLSATGTSLSRVCLLAGVGLTKLVHLRDRLTRAAASLALAAAPVALLQRVLHLSGIIDTVSLTYTVEEAVRLLTDRKPARSSAPR